VVRRRSSVGVGRRVDRLGGNLITIHRVLV
jgi:hypothetical protein